MDAQVLGEQPLGWLFGSRTPGAIFTLAWNGAIQQYIFGYYTYIGNGYTPIPNDLERHIFDHNKGDIYIDGVLRYSYAKQEYNCVDSLYVFRGHSSSGATQTPIQKANIYSLKIYENDVLNIEFVPCYRKSDNKPGMYDIVNNVFCTNAGTGEFAVGPDVN